MSSFESYILEQIRLHPAFGPQDAIKFSYQATFGAEHLLAEAASAKTCFDQEYAETIAADLPLCEFICDDYGRVNLAAWKYNNLPSEWLFQIFYLTASTPPSMMSSCDLSGCFDIISKLSLKGKLPFSAEAWNDCYTQYEAAQPADTRPQPVHHSDAYRVAERPAYRIVHTRYLRLIPILKSIAALSSHPAGKTTVIAIDGRAASGKSTLAGQLTRVMQAGLVHMDDFFLPPTLRSAERLAEAGGNVHYERFADDVLPQLRNPGPFSYKCFDCSQMTMGEFRPVAASAYRIVEGSYSCHPALGEYMDLQIFCDVAPELQMQRIIERNGSEMAQVFESRWIPMEEKYFDTFQIREKADLVISL